MAKSNELIRMQESLQKVEESKSITFSSTDLAIFRQLIKNAIEDGVGWQDAVEDELGLPSGSARDFIRKFSNI